MSALVLIILAAAVTTLFAVWLILSLRTITRLRNEIAGVEAEKSSIVTQRDHFRREFQWWRRNAEHLSAAARDQMGYAERLPDARGKDVWTIESAKEWSDGLSHTGVN